MGGCLQKLAVIRSFHTKAPFSHNIEKTALLFYARFFSTERIMASATSLMDLRFTMLYCWMRR